MTVTKIFITLYFQNIMDSVQKMYKYWYECNQNA